MAATPHGPWRGLAPYGPDDGDRFHGRERERDELARMITSDGFRAGLVYGEPGVGKTSLLEAGLLPLLREQGVTVVPCADVRNPAESLAAGLTATGARATTGEAPSNFLARVVGNAPPGHLFVFVFDDIEHALDGDDEHLIQDLAELYARALGRSGGKARFVFACASDQIHRFGHLERRTGSLFPPSNRFELGRLQPHDASAVLAAALAEGGVIVEGGLPDAIVYGLGHGGPVLPADLQIALLGLREHRVTSVAELLKAGGGAELERHWLAGAARASGDERMGLRVLAELTGPDSPASAAIAERLSLTTDRVETIMAAFAARGAVVRIAAVDHHGDGWALANGILVPRVRELAAPARAAARRAHELLGAKAATGERLSLREVLELRREGIAPTSDAERGVLVRSRRFYKTIGIAAAAAPVALLVALWSMQRGQAYLDVAPRSGGDRVVVRAGRAGLSAFDWMPSSPGFGDVVVDTGLSRKMIDAAAWSKIRDHDLGGDLAGWDRLLSTVLEPRLAALWSYATAGDKAALDALQKRATTPDELAETLVALRPIARGGDAEVQLVEGALATADAPALQQAAVAVAGAAARRNPDAYRDTLVRTLTASDPELRRIAATAVRQLGPERAQALYSAALARDPEPAIRRELIGVVAGAITDSGPPTADAAVPALADPDATPALRERAKAQLRRAFAADAKAAADAAARLITDDKAPTDSRVFALKVLLEDGDIGPSGEPNLVAPVRAATTAKSDAIRAAALPLYARVAPSGAAPDIVEIAGEKLSKPMRVAVTLAWGELARARVEGAGPALEKLIKDEAYEVRAAAAEAYGYLGRAAQEPLTKMVKVERIEVAVGAARGLAKTAEVGANADVAVGGIAQLWKKKGRARREAVQVFAQMARKKPGPVMSYLINAARSTEDDGLHPLGAEGLCAAAAQGNPEARRQLLKVAEDPALEVRRLVIACVADAPDPGKNGVAVATKLIKDPDAQIRGEAARVLALAAGKGKLSSGVGDALIALLEDGDRDVRMVAIRATGGLGADAPKGAAEALSRAFERADEGEKLVLLRAGRAVGASDLVGLAVADPSPLVRVEAVDSALAGGVRASPTVAAALADGDPQVRRAVLERLGKDKDKLEPAALERALALAIRDPDPELRQLALTTLARVAPKEAVTSRLGRALASRTERERAQAAAAAIGLVDRDAPLAVTLLTPLFDDPSHDVRVAMLASLGSAYAKVNSPDQLANVMVGAERDAMRRLAATAAFVMLAQTDAGRDAASRALTKIAERGPTMARRTAKLALGLIGSRADGIAFLEQLVP